MRLNDLNNKNVAVKALKESFSMDFKVDNLDKASTRQMLHKVRGLINEARRSSNFHKAQDNPSYLKLVFMEQALNRHLPYAKSPRIVFENEEVEKSQVILAAQDMIDTVQKMYENINDMMVKELPALVDSIQSEIGANESQSYNDAAGQALTELNSSLQNAMQGLKTALGALTGQAGMDSFAGGGPEDMPPEGGDDMDLDMDIDVPAEPGTELPPVPELDDEEELAGQVGRARR